MLTTVPVPPGRAAEIPAAVHVDGSARVQVLHDDADPLARLLERFGRLAGAPLLVNTSFNGPDEPIVDDEADARRAAARLGLDALVLGDRLLEPAEFAPPPPTPPPSPGWRDFLPAVVTALAAGLLWPSWRGGRLTVGPLGLALGVALAGWALAGPLGFRRFRRHLQGAFGRILSWPGTAVLVMLWALIVPAAVVARRCDFDPLDLHGRDDPRRAPPPTGPAGAPY